MFGSPEYQDSKKQAATAIQGIHLLCHLSPIVIIVLFCIGLHRPTLFGHSGSDIGSVTEMFTSFSDDLGVVLLSNSRNHEGMALIESAVFNYALETDFEATGDLNSDNVIDSQDIDILANLIMNGEYTFSSDLNSDNKLDILDLLAIVEIILS